MGRCRAVPYRTRSLEQFTGYFDGLEQFTGYFDGLELVEPGVVNVKDRRPDLGFYYGPEMPQAGAVGRKR